MFLEQQISILESFLKTGVKMLKTPLMGSLSMQKLCSSPTQDQMIKHVLLANSTGLDIQ